MPSNELFVSSYFGGRHKDRAFTKREMTNKIDLHHLRVLQIRRAYRYYLTRLTQEPDYRTELTKELQKRWCCHTKRRRCSSDFKGEYILRSCCRALAHCRFFRFVWPLWTRAFCF